MSQFNKKQLKNVNFLEHKLQEYLRYGRNIVIAWSDTPKGIDIIFSPYYTVEPILAKKTGDINDSQSLKGEMDES